MAVAAASIVLGSANMPVRADVGDQMVNAFAGVEIVDQNLYRHPTLASQSTDAVGVQLVLAMDTSGSMSQEEFEVQLMATAAALNSEQVRSAIRYKSGNRSIAVAVIDFDSGARLRVPWVDLRAEDLNDRPYRPDDPANSSAAPDVLDQLAQEIISLPRRGDGGTTIETALDLGYELYLGSPWQLDQNGGRRVFDLFGDGETGNETSLHAARDRLASIGVTINGFAILNGSSGLDEYYRENLVTDSRVRSPDGSYSDFGRVWAVARDTPVTRDDAPGLRAYFQDVTTGMTQKISVEIAGIDDFHDILERLGREPAIPVPEPVSREDASLAAREYDF